MTYIVPDAAPFGLPCGSLSSAPPSLRFSTFPKGLDSPFGLPSAVFLSTFDYLALRAAFGSLSRPFPKVSILLIMKILAILSPSLLFAHLIPKKKINRD